MHVTMLCVLTQCYYTYNNVYKQCVLMYMLVSCIIMYIKIITLNFQFIIKVLVAQSCPNFCYPMDCCPPGSSVHGILQARLVAWVAIPSSRGCTWVSGTAGSFVTI